MNSLTFDAIGQVQQLRDLCMQHKNCPSASRQFRLPLR